MFTFPSDLSGSPAVMVLFFFLTEVAECSQMKLGFLSLKCNNDQIMPQTNKNARQFFMLSTIPDYNFALLS